MTLHPMEVSLHISSSDERLNTLDSIHSANISQYVLLDSLDWRWNFGRLLQILEKCAHEGTYVPDLKNR
jgi:hypothetical protein